MNNVLMLQLNGAYILFDVNANKHLPMNDLEDIASSACVYDAQNSLMGDLTLFQWGYIPQDTIERLEDETDSEINAFLELCLETFNAELAMA